SLDALPASEIECPHMKNPSWPKVFAYIGLVVFGFVLAFYSTAVATAGIAGTRLGTDRNGDTLTMGSAVLVAGIAVAAVFAFLAFVNARQLMRRGQESQAARAPESGRRRPPAPTARASPATAAARRSRPW